MGKLGFVALDVRRLYSSAEIATKQSVQPLELGKEGLDKTDTSPEQVLSTKLEIEGVYDAILEVPTFAKLRNHNVKRYGWILLGDGTRFCIMERCLLFNHIILVERQSKMASRFPAFENSFRHQSSCKGHSLFHSHIASP